MMKRRFILFLILTFSLYAATACNIINNKIESNSHKVLVDYPTADNIDSIISESDYIVIGYFSEYNTTWNMARNPDNIQEEDSTMKVEGKVFKFVINKQLKGDSEERSAILVNLPYNHDGIVDQIFMEPTLNEKVILFLKYDKNFDYYYPALEPFQFMLLNDELKVKTNIQRIKKSFDEDKIKLNILEQKVK